MSHQIIRLKMELADREKKRKEKQSELDNLRLELGLTDKQIKTLSTCHNDLTKLKKEIGDLHATLKERERYMARFSINSLAHRFSVDRDTIKTWSHRFSDYFGPAANPSKGHQRIYNEKDIKVLAYITHWYEVYSDEYEESEWDEEISEALRVGKHLQLTSIQEEKIFQDISEDFAEYSEIWEGSDSAGLGGMADGAYDRLMVADAYKRAGDILAESGKAAWDIIYPVLFNYRHCIELYIKIIIKKKGHNLVTLLHELDRYVMKHYNVELPEWFRDRILEFQWMDTEDATAFRYDDVGIQDEVAVMLPRLKQIMGILEKAFHSLVKDYEENTTIHAQPWSQKNSGV